MTFCHLVYKMRKTIFICVMFICHFGCRIRQFDKPANKNESAALSAKPKQENFLFKFIDNPIPYVEAVAENSRLIPQKKFYTLEDFSFVVPEGNVWLNEVESSFQSLFVGGLEEKTNEKKFCHPQSKKCINNLDQKNLVLSYYKQIKEMNRSATLYSDMLKAAGYLLSVSNHLDQIPAFGEGIPIDEYFKKYEKDMEIQYFTTNNFMRPLVFSIGEYQISDALKAFFAQADIIGIPLATQSADGAVVSPFEFFQHDLLHANSRKPHRRSWESKVNSNKQEIKYVNLDTFIRGNYFMKDIQISKEQMRKQLFEDQEFISTLLETLKQDTALSQTKKLAVELILFIFSNEPRNCISYTRVSSKQSWLEAFTELKSILTSTQETKECLNDMAKIIKGYQKSDKQNQRLANPFKFFPKSTLSDVNSAEIKDALFWLQERKL
jgi:hypothetical protein